MAMKVMKLEMPTVQEVLEESGGNESILEELLCKLRLWLKQNNHLPQGICIFKFQSILLINSSIII